MSSAVGLYGLGETNEAGEQLEDFCLEHELALANIMFKQHPRRLYTWDPIYKISYDNLTIILR